jgi:hypothetical protein
MAPGGRMRVPANPEQTVELCDVDLDLPLPAVRDPFAE